MNKTALKIIESLEIKYKGDTDAMEEIAKTRETIEYYESKGDAKKAISATKNLEAFLHDWY